MDQEQKAQQLLKDVRDLPHLYSIGDFALAMRKVDRCKKLARELDEAEPAGPDAFSMAIWYAETGGMADLRSELDKIEQDLVTEERYQESPEYRKEQRIEAQLDRALEELDKVRSRAS